MDFPGGYDQPLRLSNPTIEHLAELDPISLRYVLQSRQACVFDPLGYRSRDRGGVSTRMAQIAEAGASASATGDHLSDLRAVNLQLQATIDALRQQLERDKEQADGAVQHARAMLADDITQLESTVKSMREQLEAQLTRSESALHSVRLAADAEAKQLKATINTLRSELESERAAGQQRAESLEAGFARDRENLQRQIQALRLELEQRS